MHRPVILIVRKVLMAPDLVCRVGVQAEECAALPSVNGERAAAVVPAIRRLKEGHRGSRVETEAIEVLQTGDHFMVH